MSKSTTVFLTGLVGLVGLVSAGIIWYVYVVVPPLFRNVMNFDTSSVPTSFYPDESAFCNMLKQNGGLHNLAWSTAEQPTITSKFMLKVAVISSPNDTTRTAMITLFKEVDKLQPGSPAAVNAINTVVAQYNCAA
jgi:hypothetical protein